MEYLGVLGQARHPLLRGACCIGVIFGKKLLGSSWDEWNGEDDGNELDIEREALLI